MHHYMGNSIAFFTTNNCSEEKGIMTKALDMLSTRTDGFSRTLLMSLRRNHKKTDNSSADGDFDNMETHLEDMFESPLNKCNFLFGS